jgi:hypothetical protein
MLGWPYDQARKVESTSYARAVEEARRMARQGWTPKRALEAVGLDWDRPNLTWDDAIHGMAHQLRLKCNGTDLPISALSALAGGRR